MSKNIPLMAQMRDNHFVLVTEDQEGNRTTHVLDADLKKMGSHQNYGDAVRECKTLRKLQQAQQLTEEAHELAKPQDNQNPATVVDSPISN